MKPKTRKTQRKKSKSTNPNLVHQKVTNLPNVDVNATKQAHKTSIVRKIRNVCNKIANSSSHVFDFDSYLLSRLKYLFNTNRHLVNVNKYFHRKKDHPLDAHFTPSQESQEDESQDNTIKENIKLNTIKSLKDVSKLDEILNKHRRRINEGNVSEDFIYKLCSYTENAKTVAAQLWHWKILDCVRRSKVSFHNFFLHTIGAAIKRMSDDEIKRFSDIVNDVGIMFL